MITLGTGVGGGVIIDEQIITGKHGLGGEIGHMKHFPGPGPGEEWNPQYRR